MSDDVLTATDTPADTGTGTDVDTAPTRDIQTLAQSVAELADSGGTSLAVAESLTGGSISAALAAAPSASSWFRGAVTAYATDVKQQVLAVPPGPVISAECAAAMASGAAHLLGADLAVAVTGVGGPDEQEGQPAGTVYVAVASGTQVLAQRHLRLQGDPQDIVETTTRWALELVDHQLRQAHHD